MLVVTRFAPSPTGALHLGHVFAASQAWRAARGAGGRFLVRLEDIDAQRCRAAYADAILADLAWLGFESDAPVRVQSAHLQEYAGVLAALRARGLLYPCFCSRARVAREVAAAAGAPQGPDGPLYPGTCRALSEVARADLLAEGAPHAWRLDMAAALAGAPALRFFDQIAGWVLAEPAQFGDVVLGRRDVPASYHLCVTHDDAAQGVTLVTRGQDLFAATHLPVLLQRVMGWPTPEYAHHRLLLGPDGNRLAKRDQATSIAALRDGGMSAASIRALAEA